MANYLPVLLVSLTNAIPDDSSLTTAPRAQVDYLSHDWQEEDVWRSWRNMTRQKNAIANGARLENASWRTWWKQRNKLGTVSPETLNWLKDSDVTWLYGPLHTAVEWKPPPMQQSALSNPATAAPARPNSPSPSHPRHANAIAPYKPILKHRSISELLTSERTVASPVLSPIDSEEDSETTDINSGDGSISLLPTLKRPALLHTKSDTLVTRWGSSRTFRKGSPSRIDSPEVTNGTQRRSPSSHSLSAGGAVRASHSQDSNSSEKSAASGSEHSQSRHKKKHISFNTFVEQFIAIDKPKKNASGYFGAVPETSLMGGRTPWVDETGYEEDQEDSEEDEKVYVHCLQRTSDGLGSGGACAIRDDSDSPGEDDDDDDDDAIEIRPTSSRSTPTLRPNKILLPRSHSKVSTTSSSSSASTSTASSSRSGASTQSTTDNTSPSGSLSPSRRISSSSSIPHKHSSPLLGGSRHVYRRSSTTTLMSTYRPSLHRILRPPLSESRSQLENTRSQHVTIAPIAPTLLKTTPTPSWTENLGDDGATSSDDTFAGWAWGVGGKVGIGEYVGNRRGDSDRDQEQDIDGGIQRRRSWTSGYGASSYGFAPGAFGTGRGRGTGFRMPYGALDKDDQGSDGTPVELVYVPPFEYDYPSGPEDGVDDVEGIQQGQVQIGECPEIEEVEDIEVLDLNLEKVYHHISGSGSVVPSSSTSPPINLNGKSNVPTVIVDQGRPRSQFPIRSNQRLQLPTVENEELAQDPYDYFGGPDMGDDYYYYPRRGGRGYEYSTSGPAATRGRIPNPKSFPRTIHAADRIQTSGKQERNGRGNGEERRSRSRSQSQSRTPSPALLSPHCNNPASPTMGNATEAGADEGHNKSASSSAANGMLAASSMRTFSQSDTLPLPARGRQLDAPSRSLNGIPQQDGRRGRSATRTSSSSSWDRERGSSGSLSSTSPMGSLSPDGFDANRRSAGPSVRNVLGTVLGGGRVDREKDRESEMGRERSGRERTSPKVLSMAASPADQSFASATSSSSSNASTIMPRQDDPEVVHMRLAEEALSTKNNPKVSNSPLLTPKPETLYIFPTNNLVDVARTPTHTSDGTILPASFSSSTSPIRSPPKFRPPLTLRPTPPSPAKPSTSFTAVISPTVTTSHPNASAGSSHAENTIVGKAVDIVSNAGLYLGLWSRERSVSAPSSPL